MARISSGRARDILIWGSERALAPGAWRSLFALREDLPLARSAALGPLYTDEVTLSAELGALPRKTNKVCRLRTSWTLSTKEDTSSTNAIHRTSERMAAFLNQPYLGSSGPQSHPTASTSILFHT